MVSPRQPDSCQQFSLNGVQVSPATLMSATHAATDGLRTLAEVVTVATPLLLDVAVSVSVKPPVKVTVTDAPATSPP